MPGAFPASSRVRKRSEYLTIQSEARRVSTRHFVLLLHAREAAGAAATSRLGVIASRKVGPAVTRNRAKRLVREAFRDTRDLWPPGTDLVVIVRHALKGMSMKQVVLEWRAVSPVIAARAAQAARDQSQRERSRKASLPPE